MNLNQFGISNVVGSIDLQTNGNPAVFTCKLSPSYAGTAVVPGEGVQLVDLGGSDIAGINPIVDVRTIAQPVFGVVLSNTKKNKSVAGDIIQVAGTGAVVWLNAGAAIPRGSSVELVVGTPGNVIVKDTGTTLGICLDKASAANDLVRILIK